MTYCRVLLKSMLILAVLLLAYVLVGIAPASAVTTYDIAVVRGTDNGVYWNSFNGFIDLWGGWRSLAGATPSPPGICEAIGWGTVIVVVRGTDDGIYFKSWTSGSGWDAGWATVPGGGRTIDQPACAYLNGWYFVVRGTGGELYWQSYTGPGMWSGWQDLHGASNSVPVLLSTPSLIRLDLFVQGTDNGIYHNAFTSGSWSGWDSPGGSTLSKPAAAFSTTVIYCEKGPGQCLYSYWFNVVVRGTDNGIYHNKYGAQGCGGAWCWRQWDNVGGQTGSAPTLAYYANNCLPASTVDCNSDDELAVRGTDNAVYYAWDYFATGKYSLQSLGGSIANSPALAWGGGWSELLIHTPR